MDLNPNLVDDLVASVFASIDQTGHLIFANAGFRKLANLDQPCVAGLSVNAFFLQPTFFELMQRSPAAEGILHTGLLTIGDPNGPTRTLKSKIWQKDGVLHVLAEHDIDTLEYLNTQVLELNQAYAKSQFELTQANLKLRQREQALACSLTELEAANLHLKTMQKQLVEADKMAALGMMVAGVAHEINTPLGICTGCASMLAQQTRTISQRFSDRQMTQSDLVGFLENATQETALLTTHLERIGRLTDSFRQTSVAAKQTTITEFNIYVCLQDVITSLNKSLQAKQVDIHMDCDKNLKIISDAGNWASIFTNLLTNSLRHGFKEVDHGVIGITIKATAGQLTLDYTDDGVGISQETQARMFEPFYTTDMQQGMGLGMHILYNIITQQMHGRIQCLDSDHRGIHIRIEIPQ